MKCRGIMHIHSSYSYDAKLNLSELKELFRAHGLAFACLTEHVENFSPNQIDEFIRACADSSDQNFIFIPGFEVPCDGQHVMLIGINKDLDLYLSPTEVIQKAKNSGALAILAHPHRNNFSTGNFGHLLNGVEIWNSHYDGKHAPRVRAIKLFKNLSNANQPIYAYAGLDFHRIEHLGGPKIQIMLPGLTSEGILQALGKGDFIISNDRIRLDSKAQTSGIGRGWIAVASPLSVALVSLSKWMSKKFKQAGIRFPQRIKGWIRKKI